MAALRESSLLLTLEKIRGSFWFIPGVITLTAVVGAVVIVRVDVLVPDLGSDPGLIWRIEADGLRGLLSTLAASMITVASVVFSITIVALTLASSQFGPRLIRRFMSDSITQWALGAFVGTFVYCLIVLSAVRGGESSFVPRFSAVLALVFVLLDVGILIFFIHHMAVGIQASTAVNRVSRDLMQVLDRQFPEDSSGEEEGPLPEGSEPVRRVVAETSGYIQVVDREGLVDWARKRDARIDLRFRPGQFVAKGQELARRTAIADDGEDADREILDAFRFGSQRSLTQDCELVIDQLTEIAMRALSPGINDPHTAMVCIDHLGGALASILSRSEPSGRHRDEDGVLRLTMPALTFQRILDVGFSELRWHARGNPAVMVRLLETLATLAEVNCATDRRKVILEHGEMICEAGRGQDFIAADRRHIDEAFDRLRAVCAAATPDIG